MNGAELHLGINHLPVILPFVGIPVLAIGLFARSAPIRDVGLWLLVAAALFALPVYFTGEPAERVVKNYPGISRMAIHEHKDAAFVSLMAIEVIGAMSLLLFFLLRAGQRIPALIPVILLLLALVGFGLMLRTAHLGGEIRHEEIQSEDLLQSEIVLPSKN